MTQANSESPSPEQKAKAFKTIALSMFLGGIAILGFGAAWLMGFIAGNDDTTQLTGGIICFVGFMEICVAWFMFGKSYNLR